MEQTQKKYRPVRTSTTKGERNCYYKCTKANNELPLSIMSLFFPFCVPSTRHKRAEPSSGQQRKNAINKKLYNLSFSLSHTHKNTLPFKLLRNWQSLSKHTHTLTHTHCLAKLFYCRFFQFFRSPGYGLWPKQLKYQTKTFLSKWVGVSVDVVFILNNRKVFVVEVLVANGGRNKRKRG